MLIGLRGLKVHTGSDVVYLAHWPDKSDVNYEFYGV